MSAEAEITRLVMKEARLLDEWRLDEWLALYSDSAVYWLPIDETADPRMTSSVVHETRNILAMRVEQMREGRHSQSPRSEIMRCITNLDVEAGEGAATAYYNMLAVETRSGDWRQRGLGEKHWYAGRGTLEFHLEDGHWRIVKKQIVLLDRRQPIEALSFILLRVAMRGAHMKTGITVTLPAAVARRARVTRE